MQATLTLQVPIKEVGAVQLELPELTPPPWVGADLTYMLAFLPAHAQSIVTHSLPHIGTPSISDMSGTC